MKAYRPMQEPNSYAPFQKWPVAEADEESPTRGPGIRINGDHDNGDPQIKDSAISGQLIPDENDLVEVRIDIPPGTTTYVLDVGTELALFSSAQKGDAIYVSETTNRTDPLNFTNNTLTVFVEWWNLVHGTSNLKLVDATTNTVVDTLTFHTFQSVIIALGGENQVPADPVLFPGNHGAFDLAIDLYRGEGFDVYMYDEDDVGVGRGPAYDVIVNAVNNHMVTDVAIYGYSHGGGSVYSLAWALNENVIGNRQDVVGAFTIPLTGYIDAITDDTMGAENRRPLLSAFHVNQYQQNTGVGGAFLNGGPSGGDDDIDRSYLGVVHTTIDDHPVVIDLLKTRILQKVVR